MIQWNKNTIPKCKDKNCSDEVLVVVEKYGGIYKRTLKAVYVPYRHCTFKDMGWNMYVGVSYDYDYEYNEEEDTWWIPQGWYEVCDYFEDCSYVPVTGEVTAWAKLPNVLEPKVNYPT